MLRTGVEYRVEFLEHDQALQACQTHGLDYAHCSQMLLARPITASSQPRQRPSQSSCVRSECYSMQISGLKGGERRVKSKAWRGVERGATGVQGTVRAKSLCQGLKQATKVHRETAFPFSLFPFPISHLPFHHPSMSPSWVGSLSLSCMPGSLAALQPGSLTAWLHNLSTVSVRVRVATSFVWSSSRFSFFVLCLSLLYSAPIRCEGSPASHPE